jgi:hypothetical protein
MFIKKFKMKYILVLFILLAAADLNAQKDFTSLGDELFSTAKFKPTSFLTNAKIDEVHENSPFGLVDDEEAYYEVLDGQASRFNGRKNWTLNKKELRFSFAATQFLGDLGGDNDIGLDYRLADWDNKAMSYAGMIGYRYRFARLFATTTSISAGVVKGDDALTNIADGGFTGNDATTTGIYRYQRNLSFRAPYIDISQRLDFFIYLKEKVGKRYNVKGLKGFKNRNEQVFVFVGVGLMGFMPQAKYEGKWTKLRPLSTEGQGLVGSTTKKYSPVTVIIPMGIGFRVGISREWRIGVETSYVKTFSDYIDDVHGTYFSSDLLAAQKGSVAAALADRSFGNTYGYDAGQMRGQPEKDSYYYLNIVLTRNVTYKNYTKTFKKYKMQKGKYKF